MEEGHILKLFNSVLESHKHYMIGMCNSDNAQDREKYAHMGEVARDIVRNFIRNLPESDRAIYNNILEKRLESLMESLYFESMIDIDT